MKWLVLECCIASIFLSGCGQSEGENTEESGAFKFKPAPHKRSHVNLRTFDKNSGKISAVRKGISEGISAGQSANIVSGTNLKGAFAGVYNPFKYIKALQQKIRENWQVPATAGTRSGAVSFIVDHTGSVSQLIVVKSSGAADYDASMLQAIEHAVPLPPLVASAPAKLPVEFTFNERLAKGVATADDWKKIVSEQDHLVQKNKEDYQALRKRGRAHAHLGEYDKALSDYTAVISALSKDDSEQNEENEKEKDKEPANPELVEAVVARAKCYLYIDSYKAALQDLEQVKKLEPDKARPYILEAAAYMGLGKLKKAFAAIDTAIKLNGNDAEAFALKANCDNMAIHHQEALADASRAIELDPEYGSAYAYRGDAYEALKDYDKALKDYSKNVELDSDEGQAYVRRAELYCTQGQFDKAVFDATEAVRLSPQSAEAFYYRAHANDELGLKAQAQKDLARAKQLGFKG
jgi:TonB family protein